MKRIFVAILSSLICISAFAQTSNMIVHNPQLDKGMVKGVPPIRMSVPGEHDGTISLTELSVEVDVFGNIATTTLDMIFYNSSSRILEGEFQFPLGDGQTVSGYALEINGRLRKGVVVDKEKGREVFEDVARKEADPGLMEKTEGNNYKTRIYPFQPEGSRHVQISYEQELSSYVNADTGKIQKQYVLYPLTENQLKKFSFEMKVSFVNAKPVNESEDVSLDFGQWNTGYNCQYSRENFNFEKPVVVTMPEGIENFGIYTQEEGADSYFYYFSQLDASVAEKKLPQSIAAFFDVSSSCQSRDAEKEAAILYEYAALNNSSLSIITFSNKVQDRKDFGKDYNLEMIVQYLNNFAYDGGTCLGSLDFSKYSCDEILLFTDGISNWQNPEPVKGSAAVTVLDSVYSADFGALKKIARDNNGNFINLCALSKEKALDTMKKEPFRLIKIDYVQGEVQEVYPAEGSVVSSDFSLSGILLSKNAKITLSFGYGSTVTSKVDVNLTAVRDEDKKMPETVIRMWAEKKIDELCVDYEKNKKEISETGKTFGIVTKDTSLIVLDSVKDYVRYGIIPPEDMLDEYNRLTLNNFKPNVLEEKGVPREVYQAFDRYRKWWNTTPEEFKKQAREEKKARNSAAPIVQTYSRASSAVEDMEFDESSDMVFAASARMTAENSIETADFSGEALASDSSETSLTGTQISIQAWSPDAEYLAVLKRTSTDKMYSKYLELKKNYSSSPSFYMDVADYFIKEGLPEKAERILSNLAEMDLENTDILRALGNKLMKYGLCQQAVWTFQKLTELKPEIPEFYRDLGLAYESIGEYQKAVEALYHIAANKWDSRFAEVQQIAINDMDAIIALHKKQVDISTLDKKIIDSFPVDIRIVLTWNTDDCDVDLWVTDPNNEKCYYGHKLSLIGGANSRDFTQGYGPEEFCLKKAIPGSYKIQADYYGTHTQKILQPVVVQAEVYTNFGTKEQVKRVLTLQLETVKGNYTVGTIDFQ